jgi:hypothetical protein
MAPNLRGDMSWLGVGIGPWSPLGQGLLTGREPQVEPLTVVGGFSRSTWEPAARTDPASTRAYWDLSPARTPHGVIYSVRERRGRQHR